MTSFSPWRSQYGIRSGTRAIVPSSFMTSQTTPAGLRPASRARSTAASVWPIALEHAAGAGAQREDVAGLDEVARAPSSGSIATWIVRERSAAEMPVVTPSRASIETVNAVPSGVSLCSVIGRRPSSSQRSSVRQRQIRPRAVRGHEVDRLGRRELGGDRRGRPRSRGRGRRRRPRTCRGGCPRSPPRRWRRRRCARLVSIARIVALRRWRAARRTSRARRPRG